MSLSLLSQYIVKCQHIGEIFRESQEVIGPIGESSGVGDYKVFFGASGWLFGGTYFIILHMFAALLASPGFSSPTQIADAIPLDKRGYCAGHLDLQMMRSNLRLIKTGI